MSNVPGSLQSFSACNFRGERVESFQPVDLARTVRDLADPARAHETLHWGRNYLYALAVETASGPTEVVVKQFRNQGIVAGLKRRLKGSKATRSWRAALALEAAQIPTASPVLVLESKDPAGPSLFVTQRLPEVFESRYFFRALEGGRECEVYPNLSVETVLTSTAALLRRLHDAGIWHRDVSIGNLLIEEGTSTPRIYLIDLNRTLVGRRMTTSRRTRDLCRLRIFERRHQDLFLASYWGADAPRMRYKSALYRLYVKGFLAKIETRRIVRSPFRALARVFKPRHAHVHIPEAETQSGRRDKVVWDRLSDQPHQHASRLQRLSVRLEDGRDHASTAAVFVSSLPRIWRRHRELKSNLYRKPVPWGEPGIAVRPHGEDPEAFLGSIEELGVRNVLLRLHPWDRDHSAEARLAQALHERGYDLVFGLPQNRDLVRDPQRWRETVGELLETFRPFGRRFQVGHAVNRSKWGIWNQREYLDLVRSATEILRRDEGVEILGPAVIDYEFYVTASILNWKASGLHFDIVSSLLYVDRRGAPENRQLGFDTLDKLVQLKAIADTSRNSAGRSWVTEVNWPLREGPHAPAGRSVAVDEQAQASYLARYYLIALGSGMVERVYWWQLLARGYGLSYQNGSQLVARPGFRALATLTRLLAGSRMLRPLEAGPEVYSYHFELADGDEMIAAWSAGGAARTNLPRPASEAVSRDGDLEARPSGLEVEIGSAPRYFRLRSP